MSDSNEWQDPEAALLQRIGGREALAVVVDEFYRRVLADPALAPAFAGVDMTRQREHQVAFLAVVLGDEDTYRGRTMREAHRGMGITQDQFAGVAAHLHVALRRHVAPEVIERVLVAIARLRGEIVGG